MKQQWCVRQYQQGDEKQILELRGITSGSSPSSQYWKWQFMDSPAGIARIWLAEADQKIVGQYAILPLRMKLKNEIIMGSLSLDTMTHPNYRHQGIFTTLANRTYEDASTNDIRITYGIPNNQSYPGFIKNLQWFNICTVPRLVKVIDWGKLLKRRFKIPASVGSLLGYAFEIGIKRTLPSQKAHIETKQISSFDHCIDEFWLKASILKSLMVVKDMKYLNWRYVNKPGHDYKIFIAERQEEILGYIVLKLRRDDLIHGFIVDLLALPNGDTFAQALIIRAIKYFREEGAIIVSCWMLESTPYYRTLRKAGFMRRPSGIRLCARINSSRLSKEFVADPNNWYFVRGDEDTI